MPVTIQEFRIAWESLADVRRWPRNPKDHDPEGLRDSFLQFGFIKPILIDERTGVLVAGHGRVDVLAAMKRAGEDPPANIQVDGGGSWQIPVIRGVSFDTEAEMAAFAVADNGLTMAGGWNQERLAVILQEVREQAPGGLAGTGFSSEDLQGMISEVRQKNISAQVLPEQKRIDAERLVDQWGTEPGQLWEIPSLSVAGRSHRILIDDSTERANLVRLTQGDRADMVFTDPPYGVAYQGRGGDSVAGDVTFTAIPLMFALMGEFLAEKAWVYVCGGWANLSLYSKMFEYYFRLVPRIIVWQKTNEDGGQSFKIAHNGYHEGYEFIYYGFTAGAGHLWYASRKPPHAVNLWSVKKPSNTERAHLTEKPVELPLRAIGNSCPPAGLVVDFFLGSGGVIQAAEMIGRVGYGIELEPKIAAVALERLANMGLVPFLAEEAPAEGVQNEVIP